MYYAAWKIVSKYCPLQVGVKDGRTERLVLKTRTLERRNPGTLERRNTETHENYKSKTQNA